MSNLPDMPTVSAWYANCGRMLTSTGRKPSRQWQQAADALRPFGLMPHEYICELRREGEPWTRIAKLLAAECGFEKPPQPTTLSGWMRIVPAVDGRPPVIYDTSDLD